MSRPTSPERPRKSCHERRLCFEIPNWSSHIIWLAISFLAIAQSQPTTQNVRDTDCYDDLSISDENGDGRVDATEYVDFVRTRVEERRSEEGYSYNVTNYNNFSDLPFDLQSNFNLLACFCSKFPFESVTSDGDDGSESCCVKEKAHLSVVDLNDTTTSSREVLYTNLICDFTSRAINRTIEALEEIQATPTAVPTFTPLSMMPSATTTLKPTILTSEPTMIESKSARPTSYGLPVFTTDASTFPPTLMTTPNETFVPRIFNTTIKAVYSILVEESADQHIRKVQEKELHPVPDVESVEDILISSMDKLVTLVGAKLVASWILPHTSNDEVVPLIPTAIDNIVDIGFTPAPELATIDHQDGKRESISETVFVGGRCPTAMRTINTINEARKYHCKEVTSLIVLEMNTNVVEVRGVEINVASSFSESLDHAILNGDLARMMDAFAPNSLVTIATGQIVPTSMRNRANIAVIIASMVVGSLLVALLVKSSIGSPQTSKQTRLKKSNSKDTQGLESFYATDEDDLEASSKSPLQEGTTICDDNQSDSLSVSEIISSLENKEIETLHSFVGEDHHQPLDRGDDVASFKSLSYLPSDSCSVNEDSRSIGGISQESDAGWSEAYTSSIGSTGDEDDLHFDLKGKSRNPKTSFSVSDARKEKCEQEASPGVQSKWNDSTGKAKMSPNESLLQAPKIIELLAETITENDDQLIIHEDRSDDEADF